ncbi:MAG: ubiquinol-cytochrome c reductase iron-sulfur subunit [Gemmatimonadaceae bacterium]
MTRSALAAAAIVVLDGCGDGQIGPSAVTLGSGVTIKVSDFPGLANVGTLVAITGDRALVRTSATAFQGFSRVCTHQGCLTDVTDNRFQCPCHGSIFASDGSVIRGPDIASPPIAPLEKLDATFNAAADTVTVA